jgi:ABC-type multidrug transport system permease subunit
MNRLRPLWQLFLARVREFYREPAALFWVYGFPVFLAVALGMSFSGTQPSAPLVDLKHAQPVAVADDADPAEASALCQQLDAAGVPVQRTNGDTGRKLLNTGKVALYVVPGRDHYDYYFDGTRPDGLAARHAVDDVVQRWKAKPGPWPTEDHSASRPGDRYIDFLIPGLIGFNLMGGGLWGVGFVIVDMRVRKLLKRFLATPMRRSDFLLSVVGSRLVFVFPEMLLLGLLGTLGFGMPLRGNVLTAILVVLVGGATFCGLGLLLACRTQKTETVSGLIQLLALPMWMLSGTFFSSSRFPAVLQPLIQGLPLTQVNDALREVVLEGASLAAVGWRLAILAAWTVVSFLLALRWFRWS